MMISVQSWNLFGDSFQIEVKDGGSYALGRNNLEGKADSINYDEDNDKPENNIHNGRRILHDHFCRVFTRDLVVNQIEVTEYSIKNERNRQHQISGPESGDRL